MGIGWLKYEEILNFRYGGTVALFLTESRLIQAPVKYRKLGQRCAYWS